LDPGDPAALQPGDIMVAPNTDPGWTPLFMTAAGVVVNVGGQISHAIIVSRELGLPCVVSIEGATTSIPDGATIEVDGNTGQVTVVDVPS
jgi:pyruvate,water dikinase